MYLYLWCCFCHVLHHQSFFCSYLIIPGTSMTWSLTHSRMTIRCVKTKIKKVYKVRCKDDSYLQSFCVSLTGKYEAQCILCNTTYNYQQIFSKSIKWYIHLPVMTNQGITSSSNVWDKCRGSPPMNPDLAGTPFHNNAWCSHTRLVETYSDKFVFQRVISCKLVLWDGKF